MAGVLTEVWTGELVKALRGKMSGTWLAGIPDESSIVENDVIHMVNVGADPEVKINNKTYPLTPQALTDGDIAVKLEKFQTVPTPVTDDELYALSYDKMQRVKEAHSTALAEAILKRAAFCIASSYTKNLGGNYAVNPIVCSGKADGTRKKLTMADVIAAKRKMDGMGVPADGRRLVLCPDNVNDLLETEQTFREQYNINRADGTIGKLYGFEIYEFSGMPMFSTHYLALQDADGTSDTDFQGSMAFYAPRVFKATGSAKMYFSEASTDPQNQQNLVAFRQYAICKPKKYDAVVTLLGKEQETVVDPNA